MYSFIPSGSSIYGFSVQMVRFSCIFSAKLLVFIASKWLFKKKLGLFHIAKAFHHHVLLLLWQKQVQYMGVYWLFYHIFPSLYIANSSQQATSCSAIIIQPVTFPQQHLSSSDLHTSHALFTSWWAKTTRNQPLANKRRPKPPETYYNTQRHWYYCSTWIMLKNVILSATLCLLCDSSNGVYGVCVYARVWLRALWIQ